MIALILFIILILSGLVVLYRSVEHATETHRLWPALAGSLSCCVLWIMAIYILEATK
jgi:hypothetical protein